MAKHDQVLISEFTYAVVASRVNAVQVGSRQFKGKQKEVMVYEVFSIVDPNTPSDGKTPLLSYLPSQEVEDEE